MCRWQEKLQLSKTSLETAWLCHEIARCYLELKQFERVHDFGEKALRAAEEASDDGWQLSINMLMGQADFQAGQYADAIDSFERALKFVHEGDSKKEEYIHRSIEDASNKIQQSEQRSAPNNEDGKPEEERAVEEKPPAEKPKSQTNSPRQKEGEATPKQSRPASAKRESDTENNDDQKQNADE